MTVEGLRLLGMTVEGLRSLGMTVEGLRSLDHCRRAPATHDGPGTKKRPGAVARVPTTCTDY
jgi:hypothetical protein